MEAVSAHFCTILPEASLSRVTLSVPPSPHLWIHVGCSAGLCLEKRGWNHVENTSTVGQKKNIAKEISIYILQCTKTIIKEYLHHNQYSMIFYNDMLHWKHISHRSCSDKVDVFHLAGNLAQPSRPAQLALQTVTGDFAGWLCDADFDATIRTPISLILADTQLPERWATIK